MIERFANRLQFSSYEDFKANYRVSYPEDFNFATHVVDAWAKEEPARRALTWCDDHGNSRSFTFSDISSLSMQAASYITSLGIKKGDMVMLLLKRRWEYWITAVALHRIGAIVIPAAYQLAAKDIVYRAQAANIRMIIAVNDPWVIEQVETARPDCKSVEHYALLGESREGWLDYAEGMKNAAPDYVKDESLTARDLMLMYFTSGTTGMPKMVMHDQSYPIGHIVTARFWQQVQDGGLHITVADSGWAKFGWGSIYGQWISGTEILGYDADNKFSPRKLIDTIRTYRPTSLCVPGTIYRFMMKEGITKEDFASVRHCGTAGEPLAPEIMRTFEEITGLKIHEGFGQSESSVLVGNFPWFSPRAGSMGKPSPLYDIRIIDENGDQCDMGEIGELVICGLDEYKPEGLLCGYWNNGELRPAHDEKYIYHTGDLVWKDEDGYLWFVGRNDDMIKCSGYRIGPFEIESVLLTHPSVQECAITGAPDPIRGQVVKATIVLNCGYESCDELTHELQDYVKHMTAPYKYPRVIEYVSALPKTTSGKIQRNRIRAAQA